MRLACSRELEVGSRPVFGSLGGNRGISGDKSGTLGNLKSSQRRPVSLTRYLPQLESIRSRIACIQPPQG